MGKCTTLSKKIIQEQTLSTSLKDKQIIIGKKLAEFHGLCVGDNAELLFTNDNENNLKQASFISTAVTIGGILDTGIMQYDKYMIISSLDLAKNYLDDADITLIGIQLQPGINDTTFMQELENEFHIDVHSWKTLYPALVAAQKLEKYVMFFLLALITLIACSNIIALIFMQVTRKKRDIALLKMLGMKITPLSNIFIFMGLILSLIASVSGIITAVGVGFFLQKCPFIKLPDAYYCTHLPIHITLQTCMFVFLLILVLTIIASWFSAQSVKKINVTHTLRFDG